MYMNGAKLEAALKKQQTEKYWKCPECGLELTFEEVCKSEGHSHSEEVEEKS